MKVAIATGLPANTAPVLKPEQSMSRNPRTVAIPGDAPAQAQGQMAAVESVGEIMPAAVEQPDESAELEAMRAKLAKLQAENAKLLAATAVSNPAPTVINPSQISGVIKTDQGYIVPETYGTPAARKA